VCSEPSIFRETDGSTSELSVELSVELSGVEA